MGHRRAGTAVIALAFVVAGCTFASHAHVPHQGSPIGSSTAASFPSPSPSATATVSPTPTTARAAPLNADGSKGPEAISFISPNHGWALGPGTCSGCARIWRTSDAGKRWSSLTSTLRLPGRDGDGAVEGGLVGVHFVNAEDGYLFVRWRCPADCALITNDGGHTWHSSELPEAGQVVFASGAVYALTANDLHPPRLLRKTPGSSAWTRLALPAIPVPAGESHGVVLAADHDTLALLQTGSDHQSRLGRAATHAERGALWISSTLGDEFTQVTNPCHDADGGAADVSVARNHPTALLLDCYNGEQSSQEQSTQHHLYGSGDDGHTWNRLADPSDTGGPGLLTDNGNGRAFLVSDGGIGYQLHVSLDGAAHWQVALRGGSGGFGMDGPTFITANTGFALAPTHGEPEHIYRTTNAGRTWHQLSLPTR